MMMSRHCFRPTVRTCTGLFVLVGVFAILIAIHSNTGIALFSLGEFSGTREQECINMSWNSATSESQPRDSKSLEARSKDGKVLGSCSLQRTEVSARVSGYLAKSSVIQNFVNLNSTSKGDRCEQLRIKPRGYSSRSSVRRTDTSCGSKSFAKSITNSCNIFNDRLREIFAVIECFSNPPNRRPQPLLRGLRIIVPNAGDQCVCRKHIIAIAHQKLQQCKIARQDMNFSVTLQNPMLDRIEGDVADAEYG